MAKKANDPGRAALKHLEQEVCKWLNVVEVASTSEARAVVPGIGMDIQEFIGGMVRGSETGTYPSCVEITCEPAVLEAAAQAITLGGQWNADQLHEAACTLLVEVRRRRRDKPPASLTVVT